MMLRVSVCVHVCSWKLIVVAFFRDCGAVSFGNNVAVSDDYGRVAQHRHLASDTTRTHVHAILLHVQ